MSQQYVLNNGDDLSQLAGLVLGPSAWHEVTQQRIDRFAEATGDHQWIHVDPARAAASAFGSTIAHGLYTLSLGPAMLYELLAFDGFAQVINYGYDRVRFPAPLPVGASIRMTAEVTSAEPADGGTQLRLTQRFERDGHERPVAVAESLARLVERR